jgi:hypothetical protein
MTDIIEVIAPLDRDAAVRLDKRIRLMADTARDNLAKIAMLVDEAKAGQIHEALGFPSWTAYLADALGGQLELSTDTRRAVVELMAGEGMSQRAIAAAVGVSQKTVDRDLDKVSHGDSPEPAPVTGLDGKTYTPPAPKPAPTPVWTEEELALRKAMENGETIVVSLRGLHSNLIAWAEDAGLYVRIDRRTDWGNPFEIPDDGDRDDVINKFATHYLPHKTKLQERLPELAGKALGCWCAPEACHGDVLKEAAKSNGGPYDKADPAVYAAVVDEMSARAAHRSEINGASPVCTAGESR